MNPFKPIILLSILALGTLYSQEESLTADQVWTKVLEKYSSCKSFECTFVESEDNGKEGIGGFKKDKTGMLRFQAPDLLRIDWMDSMAGQMTSSSSFVREGKKYFYWGQFKEYQIDSDGMLLMHAMNNLVQFLPAPSKFKLPPPKSGTSFISEGAKEGEYLISVQDLAKQEFVYRVSKSTFDLLGYTKKMKLPGIQLDLKKSMEDLEKTAPGMKKIQEAAMAQMDEATKKIFEDQMAQLEAQSKQESIMNTECQIRKTTWNNEYSAKDFDYELPQDAPLVEKIPSKPINEYFPILKLMK